MSRKNFDKVQDSGQRKQFGSGAVRDLGTGKGRFDLMSPIGNRRLARHYENGATKYEDRNWEKGMPLHRFLESAIRHVNDYLFCRITGEEQSEDHLAAAVWNLYGFMHTDEMITMDRLPPELDDLPNASHPKPKKKARSK